MAGKFELYTAKNGKFRFRLKAGNGEIIAISSEDYETKAAAKKGIASIKKNAATADLVDTDAVAAAATKAKAAAEKAAAKAAAPKKAATRQEGCARQEGRSEEGLEPASARRSGGGGGFGCCCRPLRTGDPAQELQQHSVERGGVLDHEPVRCAGDATNSTFGMGRRSPRWPARRQDVLVADHHQRRCLHVDQLIRDRVVDVEDGVHLRHEHVEVRPIAVARASRMPAGDGGTNGGRSPASGLTASSRRGPSRWRRWPSRATARDATGGCGRPCTPASATSPARGTSTR